MTYQPFFNMNVLLSDNAYQYVPVATYFFIFAGVVFTALACVSVRWVYLMITSKD